MRKSLKTQGEILKDARKAAGEKRSKAMSQKELADALGVSVESVRGWEHNRSACTKHWVLAKYAELSGFSIDYLSGSTDNKVGTMLTDGLMDMVMLKALEFAYLQAFYHIRFCDDVSVGSFEDHSTRLYMSTNEADALLEAIHASVKAIINNNVEILGCKKRKTKKPGDELLSAISMDGQKILDYTLNELRFIHDEGAREALKKELAAGHFENE